MTSYDYDVLDALTTVTQGTQTPRSFVYDSLKRLSSASNPESGTLSYQYDNNGNLTRKTDARGTYIDYVYDPLNRNTTVNYSDTTINPDITRFYDGATNGKGRFWYNYAGGNYSTGSNVEHTAIDSYDALGRPLVQRQLFKLNGTWGPTYQTQRGYNLAGSVTSQTYPSGRTVGYSYDTAGRTNSFSGNLGDGVSRTYATGIVYSPFGGMSQEQFGTDVPIYNKLHYNVRGQLYDMRASSVANDEWNWNRGAIVLYYGGYPWQQSGPLNNGNVTRAQSWVPGNDQVSTYTLSDEYFNYDQLNRLTSVNEYYETSSQAAVQKFAQVNTFDRYGNRTIDGAQTWGVGFYNKQFTVNPANNRLGVPVGQSGVMSYDNAGNLITDSYTGGGSRTYDAENRMTQAWENNQWQFYTYNADGQRVRRKVDGVETWQIYGMDGELVVECAANAASSAPQKEYGYRNGQLLITAEPSSSQSSSETYQASTDFSGVQGQRNWYYLDSTGALMGFNGQWQGPETYLVLWGNGGHPGEYADAVRQWRAPGAGTLRITGNASDAHSACGDGVIVSIKKGTQVLWQQTIENGNASGFSYDLTTTVVVGDQINFVINKRGNWGCDSTNFDPTITFSPSSSSSYQASADFSGVQGQRNWYYLDSTGALMGFNGQWQGPETYLVLWGNGGHPGEYADAVRQWRAPGAGTLRITGNASDAHSACGDGVIVSIKKGTQVLWQQTIENGNASGFSYDLTTSVVVGDQINFVINKRGNWGCDSTNFDPTITYTGTGSNNLALNKPATQTSDLDPLTVAGKAVDGNTDGALWNGYASATNYQTNAWWQVDLQSVQSIGTIEVWGRTDCCPEMTANFYVFVSDSPFTSYDLNTTLNQSGVSNYYVPGYSGTPGTINVNRSGRYVRVQFAASQYLILGEVKVLSSPAGSGGAGGIQWLVSDQLGTPRIIVDKTGSLANVKRHDYLPFGEELFAGTGGRTTGQGYSGDNIRQKFTSKERDNETGLDYFLARYYSSTQGRFTSVDPENAGAVPDNPQSWNGYAYVFNNPLKYQDPDGLSVRICGTDGKCTDEKTDLSDEDFNKRFRDDKSIKLKDGNIFQNGEQIGTYENRGIDGAPFSSALMEAGRQPYEKAMVAFAGASVALGTIAGVTVYAAPAVAIAVGERQIASRIASEVANAAVNRRIYGQLEKQLATAGAKSIYKALRNAEKALEQHVRKSGDAYFKSSIEGTIKNVANQIKTIQRFIKDKGL